MKKQTAVEILIEQLIKYKLVPKGTHVDNVIFHRAKEMEKQQIMDAWENGYDEDDRATSNPLNYFNETFNSEK